jgi:hypothetical protein
VRVLSDWYVSEEWCVLYVTGIFKRGGTCCRGQACFRGVMRVACEWDIKEEWCVLHVTGIFKKSGACYL